MRTVDVCDLVARDGEEAPLRREDGPAKEAAGAAGEDLAVRDALPQAPKRDGRRIAVAAAERVALRTHSRRPERLGMAGDRRAAPSVVVEWRAPIIEKRGTGGGGAGCCCCADRPGAVGNHLLSWGAEGAKGSL